jgi:hypothetical protein
VETASWHSVYDCPNIDGKLEHFNNIMTELMEVHAPLKQLVNEQINHG